MPVRITNLTKTLNCCDELLSICKFRTRMRRHPARRLPLVALLALVSYLALAHSFCSILRTVSHQCNIYTSGGPVEGIYVRCLDLLNIAELVIL